MKKRLCRLTAVCVIAALCLTGGWAARPVHAEEPASGAGTDAGAPAVRVPLPAAGAVPADGTISASAEYEGRESVLLVASDTGTVTWRVTVPQAGDYRLAAAYYALDGKSREIEFDLLVDDRPAVGTVARVTLSKQWRYAAAIASDSRGNDMLPDKEFVPGWQESLCGDQDGAFVLALGEGEHTVTMEFLNGNVALADMTLLIPQPLPAYAAYRQTHAGVPEIPDIERTTQGEAPSLLSDPAINPQADRSSAATDPADPQKLKLNTIGSSSWQTNGQWIEWAVDVPETGLYTLGFKVRQNLLRGQTVFRRLYIDGATPFAEAAMLPFTYKGQWYNQRLCGEDGEPYRFYLEKGARRLRLEVVYGSHADSVARVEETLLELNAAYRRIHMITGAEPDPYTDYFVHKEIPGLLDTLERCRQSLSDEKAAMENLSGQKIQGLAVLETLAVQLAGFLKKPDSIPTRLQSFKDNIAGLSSFIIGFKNQPLEIDYLGVYAAERAMPTPTPSFFQALAFRVQAFAASFTGDYDSIGDVSSAESPLDVWVTLGRDHAQVIKQLVDNQFSPQHGTPVKISLVQQGAATGVVQQPLLQATMAGQGPDIALFVNTSDPVNLAARGVLCDLSRYPEYGEITRRFSKNAMVPYEYEGGAYALPLTEAFYMMFYRTDILAELNIEPPDTWEDVYAVIPVLQRKNLEIGFPAVAVNPGAASVANNALFQMLLFQKGGTYYNEDRTRVELDSSEALEAFKQWTAYYAQFSFPLEYDFYSRFRTGEMPLAIDSYSMFNKLNVATPELKGLWDFAPIPATVRPDGTLDRTTVGGGAAAVMFTKTRDQEKGWQFLQWFTSAAVQAEFGHTIENLVGAGARFETANIEAFKQLPWQAAQQEAILAQWEQMQNIPQTPASYYEFRSVYNAFRKVVFSGGNPREVLFKYTNDINKEIRRKREEFGLAVPPEETLN